MNTYDQLGIPEQSLRVVNKLYNEIFESEQEETCPNIDRVYTTLQTEEINLKKSLIFSKIIIFILRLIGYDYYVVVHNFDKTSTETTNVPLPPEIPRNNYSPKYVLFECRWARDKPIEYLPQVMNYAQVRSIGGILFLTRKSPEGVTEGSHSISFVKCVDGILRVYNSRYKVHHEKTNLVLYWDSYTELWKIDETEMEEGTHVIHINYTEILDVIMLMEESYMENSSTLGYKAEKHYKNEEYELARQFYMRAFYNDPSQHKYIISAANMLLNLQENDRAMHLFKYIKSMQLSPEYHKYVDGRISKYSQNE